MTSHPDTKAAGGWQPIETAPKDGERFLAYCELRYCEEDENGRVLKSDVKEKFQVVAYWAFGGFVEFPFRGSVPQNLTFLKWQPLPEPPPC
jgi:hypothetical protein